MEWVGVEDELPKEDKDVLVYNGKDLSVSAIINGYGNQGWHERDDGYDYGYVTHWMPLPQPPKEWHDKK